jgi:uncharacterized protein
MSSHPPLSATPRTRLRRYPERGRPDRADLYAVLDAGFICHLGVICDGEPRVLPTAYGRIGDTLYLHGSTANRTLLAADGRPACVTVMHLDGVVCARAMFHHSFNYRSAMVYGTARIVHDEAERLAALRVILENIIPGRWDASRAPNRKELAATAVLALPLDEASVKVRSGPPADDPEDYDLAIWAGVVPAHMEFGAPEPDGKLHDGIPIPRHIRRLHSADSD